ncbi:MAG: putative ABC transporter permease [Treponemataceae bacterium]
MYIYLFYFFVYAVLGWALEVLYHFTKYAKFINRGILNGPYCPIYAFGGLGILLFVSNYTDSFWHVFLSAALFGSILELVGGFLIDKIFNLRFWNYSDVPFNIGGYICLKFSLCWGLLGLFFINHIHPLIAKLSSLIPNIILKILVIIGFLMFMTDLIITIAELFGLKKLVSSLAKQKAILKNISDNFGQNITSGATKISKDIKVRKVNLESKNDVIKAKYAEKLAEYKTRLSKIKEKLSYGVKRRFKVFPKLKSRDKDYNEVINEIKDNL